MIFGPRNIGEAQAGPFDIFVRPVDGGAGPWRVTTSGAAHPVWSKSGGELLFTTEDQIMTLRYHYDGRTFKAETPRPSSAVRYATAGPRANTTCTRTAHG